MRLLARIIAIVALVGLAVLAFTSRDLWLAPLADGSRPPAGASAPGATEPTPTTTPATGVLPTAPALGQNVVPAVYRRVSPSVVSITSLVVIPTFGGLVEEPQGVGSGFIIDTQGHIVTNDHVVEEADQLQVTFSDRTTVPARLVGRDPDNDLAVVKVDGPRDKLTPVTWGDSDKVVIGETAIAIGSPFGLDQTVTAGVVSARRQPLEGAEGQGPNLLGGALQTDAAINPGNSGGPLLNARGEVIGVNTAIFSRSGGNVGVGFAIPANVAQRVVPELIAQGYYRHPVVGLATITLTPRLARALQLPVDQGLLVQAVGAGAAQAGIRAGNQVVRVGRAQIVVGGDIVTAVDGRPVRTETDLRAYVENFKRVGDEVVLTIVRNGRTLEVPVTLTERRAR